VLTRNIKTTLRSRHGEQFCPELNEDELDEQLDREYFDDQQAHRVGQTVPSASRSSLVSAASGNEQANRKSAPSASAPSQEGVDTQASPLRAEAVGAAADTPETAKTTQ
jgi:hypothetical protein